GNLRPRCRRWVNRRRPEYQALHYALHSDTKSDAADVGDVPIATIFLQSEALSRQVKCAASLSGTEAWGLSMLLHRRRLLHLPAGAAGTAALPRIAGAQSYPSRPVRLVVPFPAGGPNDVFARLISQWLSERLNQSFVIDNRSGAGGNIGTEAVVRAPP